MLGEADKTNRRQLLGRGHAGWRRRGGWALFPLALAAVFPAVGQVASVPDRAELEQYARLPVCRLSADGQHLAVQPCRTAPARLPMPRRPVTPIIEPLPAKRVVPQAPLAPIPAATSAGISAAPVLMPAPAFVTPVPMNATPPSSAPRALNNCRVGGCNDAQGGQLNNAAPGMVITPQGQVCSRNGVWIQC